MSKATLNFRTNKDREHPAWARLKGRAYVRSRGSCEFCGRDLVPSCFELHHRWYPSNDTLGNLMAIHSGCHKAIHFGGKIKAASGSLAASGDSGKDNNQIWQKYINP